MNHLKPLWVGWLVFFAFSASATHPISHSARTPQTLINHHLALGRVLHPALSPGNPWCFLSVSKFHRYQSRSTFDIFLQKTVAESRFKLGINYRHDQFKYSSYNQYKLFASISLSTSIYLGLESGFQSQKFKDGRFGGQPLISVFSTIHPDPSIQIFIRYYRSGLKSPSPGNHSSSGLGCNLLLWPQNKLSAGIESLAQSRSAWSLRMTTHYNISKTGSLSASAGIQPVTFSIGFNTRFKGVSILLCSSIRYHEGPVSRLLSSW